MIRGGRTLCVLAVALLSPACAHITRVKPVDVGRRGVLDRLLELKAAGLGHRDHRPVDASDGEDAQYVADRSKGWQWPLKSVQVTSSFGSRQGSYHEGIDLRAGVGTSVYASEAGQVVYSGDRISGYGRMVVIKHPGNLFTVYAHNSRNLVSEGTRVKRGQHIAQSGKSGRASGPHVHFEVRRGTKPVDPASVMPKLHSTPVNGKLALFR